MVDFSKPQPSTRQQAASRGLSRGQSAAAARYSGMARAAGIEPSFNSAISRRAAVKQVQQREEQSQASMPKVPSLIAGLMTGLGSFTRKKIIEGLEAGGTPVRENGVVIGVMRDGRYTGRPRQGDQSDDDGGGTGAQQAASQSEAEAPAGPPVVRRSALAQQIEAENRRRRLAGMRRLGSRTLLSGDRFTSDTLGA